MTQLIQKCICDKCAQEKELTSPEGIIANDTTSLSQNRGGRSFIPQLVEQFIADKNGSIQAVKLYQSQTNILQCLRV